MSPFDLTLDLGYRSTAAPPAQFPVRAVMSWEEAKSLRNLLDSAVTEYEQEVGAIREFGSVIGPAQEAPDLTPLPTADDEEAS